MSDELTHTHPLPAEVQAAIDAQFYGMGFILVKPDGTTHRLSPLEVIVVHPEVAPKTHQQEPEQSGSK